MRIRLRLLLLITAGLLLVPGQALSAKSSSDPHIKSFQAEYRVSLGSIPAGKIAVSLELDANGGYRYRQHSTPVGLLAAFVKDEITEISEGRIHDFRVIPSSYRYKRERSKKPKQVHLLFDWETGRVTSQASDPGWSLEIPEGTQDRFSKQLALIVAMNGTPNEVAFRVADDERLKIYRFRPQGPETIEIGERNYQTLKIARSKGERPPKATLWLAPELHFLPVKVEKLEKGKRFVMELISVQWRRPDMASLGRQKPQ
jgi:hypothetical protein